LGNRVWLENGEKFSNAQVASGKRVGIDYAEEYAEKPWRFWVRDNLFVSKR
jgi:DNA-3-methyladenine glycosylase